MDRDPFIQCDLDNRSASVIQVESLGKGGIAVVLATGLVAVVIAALAYGLAGRAMDRANTAEREARIAQDQTTQLQIELGKKGINVRADGH